MMHAYILRLSILTLLLLPPWQIASRASSSHKEASEKEKKKQMHARTVMKMMGVMDFSWC